MKLYYGKYKNATVELAEPNNLEGLQQIDKFMNFYRDNPKVDKDMKFVVRSSKLKTYLFLWTYWNYDEL
jgi:hypothetical protein